MTEAGLRLRLVSRLRRAGGGAIRRGAVVALSLALAACAAGSPAATPTAIAPSPSVPEAPSPVVTGGYFAVSVADLDASQRWYEEKLGLDVVLQPPAASGVAIVVLRGEGLIVELIHQDTGVSPADVVPALADRTLLHGFAKAGAIVGDLDAVLAQLRARGVPIKFGPYAATSDQPANLIIEDNEGNLIQFIGS